MLLTSHCRAAQDVPKRSAARAPERMAVAAVLAEEQSRAAEIAALERKLRETRRRHAEELSRLGRVPSAVVLGEVVAREPHDPRAELLRSSASGPRPVEGNGGKVGAVACGAAVGGPILASRRRDIGQHTFRLWVEDCPASRGARVHAMDEATGSRTCSDVSDTSLSTMLANFRSCQGQALCTGDQVDVDDFLYELLGSVHFVASLSGAGLELRLPADVAPSCQPHAATWSGGGSGSRASPDASRATTCGPQVLGAKAQSASGPGLGSRPPAETPPLQLQLHAVPDILVRPVAGNPGPPLHGAPCLQRGGPRNGRGTAPWQLSQAMAAPAVAAPRKDAIVAKPTVDPARPPGRPSGRPCAHVTVANKSAHRRAILRPQSAPNSAKRPQSARMSGRDDRSLDGRGTLRKVQEERRVSVVFTALDPKQSRRTRPASAKAMKHRREADDGSEPIIYEDVEEEGEEASEQEETIVAGPTEPGCQPAGKTCSSTGGCGSCSSSTHGSLHTAPAGPHTELRAASPQTSATSDAGAAVQEGEGEAAADSGKHGLEEAVTERVALPSAGPSQVKKATAAAAVEEPAAAEIILRSVSLADENTDAGGSPEEGNGTAIVPQTASVAETARLVDISASEALKAREAPEAIQAVAQEEVLGATPAPQSCTSTVQLIPRPPPLKDSRPCIRTACRSRGLQTTMASDAGQGAITAHERSLLMSTSDEEHRGVRVAVSIVPPLAKDGDAHIMSALVEPHLRTPLRWPEAGLVGDSSPSVPLLGQGPRASSPPPRGTARRGLIRGQQ